MRWQLKIFVFATLAVVGFTLATSQGQFQLGGLGGLMGLPKEGKADPITLLRNAEVKKELRLTEEQSTKVDMSIWKALEEALQPDQYKRLKQIDIQQRDYKAFADPIVQDELKLDGEQKSSINTILSDSDRDIASLSKAMQDSLAAGGFGSIQGTIEKMGAIRKETKERCTDVLTPEQRRHWHEMVGEDFRMITPQFNIPDFKIDPKAKKGGKTKKG